MFEGRAEQVDLISLLSTGEARGSEGGKLVTASVLDLCEGCSSICVHIYFELRCLIVGEIYFFQPTQLSGFVLNGKVKVMLITICSLKSVKSRDDTRERRV